MRSMDTDSKKIIRINRLLSLVGYIFVYNPTGIFQNIVLQFFMKSLFIKEGRWI